MGRWIFLRHGESVANATRRLSGWEDVPLSASGRDQARACQTVLEGERIDRVLVSDLRRAWQTAELAVPGLALTPAPLLRERRLGAFQGAGIDAVRADGRMGALTGWATRPPGGESHLDLARRALPWLAALPPTETTLVVAHGGMLRVLLGLIDGLPTDEIGRWKIPNAIPMVRRLEPSKWASLATRFATEPPPPGLVLASGSPRRRALLRAAGVEPGAICPPDIPELPRPGEGPARYARRLAREKAAALTAPHCWVLAADTVVHLEGELMEKPRDDADALRMLTRLQGRWHRVSTAWRLVWGGPGRRQGHSGCRTTSVRFRAMGEAELSAYIATGEGRDKAGSYGIQGLGGSLVDRVRGDYPTVVGLPVGDVLAALRRLSGGSLA